jgi:hypothetical protein
MVLELRNNTPFTCQQLPLLDKKGANILRIVLKAGYEFTQDGGLQIAEDQPEVVMEDKYWGEPGQSSVRYESDVTLDKPHTDLVINGHAHAPRGRAVREMNVYVRYQERLLKRLRVFGDRVWKRGPLGWRKTTPKPFVKMPIVYDRAYGGSDEKGSEPRNRSGTGYASRLGNKFKGTPVPNIEFPNQLIKSPRDKPTPAGLGVISKNWEPRLSFAGTYDDAWLENGFPLLPHDFDMRFNQSAPPDQWIARPQGGEVIKITGMSPDGDLHIKLPPCLMRLTLHYKDHSEDKPMDLDTILIEPDEQKLTLTWRASADIHGDPFRLLEMIIEEASEERTANSGVIDSGRWENERRQSLW